MRTVPVEPARYIAVEAEQSVSTFWETKPNEVFVNLPALPNLSTMQVSVAVDVVNREQLLIVHATADTLAAIGCNNFQLCRSIIRLFLGEDDSLIFPVIGGCSLPNLGGVLAVVSRVSLGLWYSSAIPASGNRIVNTSPGGPAGG